MIEDIIIFSMSINEARCFNMKNYKIAVVGATGVVRKNIFKGIGREKFT